MIYLLATGGPRFKTVLVAYSIYDYIYVPYKLVHIIMLSDSYKDH